MKLDSEMYYALSVEHNYERVVRLISLGASAEVAINLSICNFDVNALTRILSLGVDPNKVKRHVLTDVLYSNQGADTRLRGGLSPSKFYKKTTKDIVSTLLQYGLKINNRPIRSWCCVTEYFKRIGVRREIIKLLYEKQKQEVKKGEPKCQCQA